MALLRRSCWAIVFLPVWNSYALLPSYLQRRFADLSFRPPCAFVLFYVRLAPIIGQASNRCCVTCVAQKPGFCFSCYFFPELVKQGNPDSESGPWKWQHTAYMRRDGNIRSTPLFMFAFSPCLVMGRERAWRIVYWPSGVSRSTRIIARIIARFGDPAVVCAVSKKWYSLIYV